MKQAVTEAGPGIHPCSGNIIADTPSGQHHDLAFANPSGRKIKEDISRWINRCFRDRTIVICDGIKNIRRNNGGRSEERTSELQSLLRRSYAVFGLNKKYRKNQK